MNKALYFRLGLPFIAWAFVYYESVISMVNVWMQSKTYEHSFLILPISLWLVHQKKEQIKKTPISISWIPILLLLLPSLLWMLGKEADISLFEHASAIISLQLMLWALLGAALTKLLFFPILYLWFCIPFGEELIPYLQSVTADMTVLGLQLTNIPVFREGLYISIPKGLFEVAEACSGIRFLISTLALGTLFAYLSFNRWWKIACFIIFSFIFPIIANGIRAYGIVLIAHLSDMQYATGADHLVYGWVFFSIVILSILSIAIKFADKKSIASTNKVSHFVRPSTSNTSMLFLSLLSIYFYQFYWQNSMTNVNEQVVKAVKLPNNSKNIDNSNWGISFPLAQKISRGITFDGRAEFFNARYALKQTKGELISSTNHLYDQDRWSLSQHSKQRISLNIKEEFHATQLTLANFNGDLMKILYWYCIDDFCSSNPLKIKLFKATKLMTEKSGTADIWAVASINSTDEYLQDLASAWLRKEIN